MNNYGYNQGRPQNYGYGQAISPKQGGYKPKSNIGQNVSEKEKMEALAALKSLKSKMANAPKPSTANNYPNYNQSGPKPGVRSRLGPMNPNFGGGNMGAQDMMYNAQKPRAAPARGGFGGNRGVRQMGGMGMGNMGNMGNMGGGSDNRPIGGGMTEMDIEGSSEPTYPCPSCGRSFNSQALQRHQKICQKVFKKKRKAFNTANQRIAEPEQLSLMKQGQMEMKKNPKLNNKKTGAIPKWKLQSMQFRSMCNPNAANRIRKELGIPANPMPMPSKAGAGRGNKGQLKGSKFSGANNNMGGGFGSMGGMDMYGGGFSDAANDFTFCKFCGRSYNDEAYNKHLNGCKRRYEEAQIRNKINKKPTGKSNIAPSYGRGAAYGRKKK